MKISYIQLVILLSSIAIFASPVHAGELKIYRATGLKSGQYLKIYSRPTVHSNTIAKLASNARWIVKLADEKHFSHSVWNKVACEGKRGWVNGKYIKYDKNASKIVSRNRSCLYKSTRTKVCKSPK